MNTKEWNAKFIMYRRTIKHLKDAVNHDLNTQGISLQHATYLLLLANNGSLKIKELNALSDNDAALTTRVLKLLLEKQYVERTCPSVRKCKIFLTSKGQDVVNFIGEVFARIRNELSSSANQEGQEALLSAILS
ncbi:MAG: MarR family transcriptional regulator [Bacilli bacterium]|nr:MarR family transcriptional regulator [Bacilli bacterium]